VPCVIYADRRNRLKHVFLAAVLLLMAAEAGLFAFHRGLWQLVVGMVAYFTAFNVLEAILPSLVSRLAPSDMKGTALGAYSTAQYFGAFLGGLCGGWVYGRFGMDGVFAFCAVLCLVWFFVAAGMRNPRPLTTHLLRVGAVDETSVAELVARLTAVSGVAEAVVVPEDGIAYLKVDRRRLDREALRAFSVAEA